MNRLDADIPDWPVTHGLGSGLSSIYESLRRTALADARQRAALTTRFGLSEREILALQYLLRPGELSTAKLGNLLRLSSGGASTLVQRLQRAGHVTRDAHSRKGERSSVRLTPATQKSMNEARRSLVSELDALGRELTDDERETVARFLQRAADAAERHAERLARKAEAKTNDALTLPLPKPWA